MTVLKRSDGRVDPVTLQVIRNSLETSCQEAGITLMRTSYTPMVKEGTDFGAAVFDSRGEMIASAGFVMAHNVSMPYAVRELIKEYSPAEMHSGDAFITNDPYLGSNHLPDVTLISPYVEKGEVIAYSANRTHWSDVGGMFAGSMSGTGTEIYQEGVRIPIIKIASRDQVNKEVLSLMVANMRVPEDREGDLRAQIAANRSGVKKMVQIIKRYGRKAVFEYAEALKDYSERLTRYEIESIPSGRYEAVEFMDNNGVDMDKFVKLKLTLTINGSDITADFTGSDPQSRGSVNLTYPNTTACIIEAMRFLCAANIPLNQGCFRPVRVVAPEGTIVHPRFPAATALGPTGLWKVIRWAYYAALAPAVPSKIAASEYNATGDFLASGYDSKRRRQFVLYTLWEGGSGGGLGKDGMNAIRHGVGALMNTPVEILEAEYPILVEQVALRRDSGGPGRFPGGLGVVRRYRALDNIAWSIASEKNRIAPWGLFGGKPSARAEVSVERPGGVVSISKMGGKIGRIDLSPGDVLVLQSPGGGGFGDPLWRDPERVRADYSEGYVSPDRAKEEYGVIIDPSTHLVDHDKTEKLREEMRPRAPKRRIFSFDIDLPEIREVNERAEKSMDKSTLRYLATGEGSLASERTKKR